jgi:hypothetical protein
VDDLPQPLVPADHDVSMLSDFRLHVDRLLASELVAIGTPEECWAALMLWCRAWKQTPGGSLPNDERALAGFSGAGKQWKKVRPMAMHGFVLCSDGRFYHPVLCDEVKRAYASRAANIQRREADRKRLSDWRAKHTGNGLDTPYETADETRFVAEVTEETEEKEALGVEDATRTNLKIKTNLPFANNETNSARASDDPTTPAAETEPILETLSPELPESEGRFSKFVGRAPLARSARSAAIAALRRDQLQQKLIRFSTATMQDPELSTTVGGLCGADPEHSDQWWLDHVDKLMRAKHWDDTRQENAA